MATLAGTDLGIVTRESRTKDAQLFQQPMPVSDSTQAIILDLFGCVGTIEIEGKFTSNLSTAISFLEGLANGSQSRIVYASDLFSRTFNVYVQNVNYETSEGSGQTVVTYHISLIEGS